MQKTNIKDFIKAYLDNGYDYIATAKDLSVSRAAAYQRVIKLRKAGVKLPVKRVGKSYNVSELNKLIKTYKEQ